MSGGTDKEKEFKIKIKDKEEKTFEEWIDSNSKNPLIVGSNGILTKNNVSHSDISMSKSSEETIKEEIVEIVKVMKMNEETGEEEEVEEDGHEQQRPNQPLPQRPRLTTILLFLI